MKNNVLLLGDSVIDNKRYVQDSEYSVLEHLQNNSKDTFIQIACDGDTTHDVINKQAKVQSIKKASHIVLSIGGNDMLYNLSFLTTNKPTLRNEAFIDVYNEIFQPLEVRYETIVKNFASQRANLLLCTVYEGDLGRSEEFKDVLDSSKIMVSSLNDIIYKTASRYNAEVLELRNIFTSSEDYANPIEPSHIGGEKLAKKIIEWVKVNEN